jgi:hypothetical protein
MAGLHFGRFSVTLAVSLLSNESPADYFFFFRMYTSPVRGLRTVEGNRVVCVRFRDPKYPAEFVFPSVRLNGAR